MTFHHYLKQRDPLMYEGMGFKDVFGFDPNDKNLVQSFKGNIEKKVGDVTKIVKDTLANPMAKATKPDQGKGMMDKAMDLLRGNKVPQGIDPNQWKSTMNVVSPTGKPQDIGKGQLPDLSNVIAQGVEKGALPANTTDVLNSKAPWLKVRKAKPQLVNQKTATEIDPNSPPSVDPKKKQPGQI